MSEEKEKPKLRVPVECYTRTVGYLRPVQNMHKGKRQEVKERKMFDLNKAMRRINGKVGQDQGD